MIFLKVIFYLLIGIFLFQEGYCNNLISDPDFPSRKLGKPSKPLTPEDFKLARKLGAFIKIKTFSNSPKEQFTKYQDLLKKTFPLVFTHLISETVGRSLLLKWKGENEHLNPIGLIMHQDVVPADYQQGNRQTKWKVPPFSGVFRDGFIWGRGTVDMKSFMIASLNAVERLLQKGHKPNRSIYFILGHDEEIGGHGGSKKIAELLKKRNVSFKWILDEGLMVTHGMMKGFSKPIALIGISQKGYANAIISVKQKPGHSSMPPKNTAIGLLASGLKKIEENPLPLKLTVTLEKMLKSLAPYTSFPKSLIFNNPKLFSFVIKSIFNKKDSTRAFVQTTQAITLIKGGTKENMIPSKASANINLRTLPGDSFDSVKKHLENLLKDERFTIKSGGNFMSAPSKESCTNCPQYKEIRNAIKKVYPKSLIAPSLYIGGSDGMHFKEIAKNIYFFTPQRLSPETKSRLHGYNEKISIEVYKESIQFYQILFQNQR
jgi:carboxypeptidase PM20D1